MTVAKQTGRGVPAAAVTTGLRVTSTDVGAITSNIDADPEIGGNRDRNTAGVALGAFHAGGNLEGYVRYDALGYLLLAAGFVQSGAPTEIEAGTGAYAHTFTPGVATPLTLETSWGRNRAVRRFVDTFVNSLEFSVAGDDFARFSAEVLALSETYVDTPSVPVWASPDPMGTYLGSAAELSALGTYRLGEMTWSLANNMSDDETVIGSRFLADTTPGRREVGFSGTIKPSTTATEVTALYRAGAYGAPDATVPLETEPYHTATTMTFGSGRKIGTATDTRYGVEVTMPDTVLNAFALEGSGADPIEAQVEGIAYAGAAPVATIVLRNARATAY